MTEYCTRKGPGLSPAQKIGDIARSALYANKPDHWFLGEIGGDDFGYDFQVTVFDPAGEGAQCNFNIQLKGTTQKNSRLADGKAISYPFDRTTLNLWHRSGFAVLVVIVDLIDTQDQKAATVHYHLVNYDINDILPALRPEQKTVQLRIPTKQLVHKGLDILPVVLQYLDEIADALRVSRERRRAGGTATPDQMSIGAEVFSSNAVLSHLAAGDELEALIEASPNRAELQAALAALRNGDYERVIELCPHPTEEACMAARQNSAIIAYLRSMALDAVGDSYGADALITLAVSLLPECDGIAGAAAQKQLEAIALGANGHEARNALINSLQSLTGLSVTTVKSKLLALNGAYGEARDILKPFSPEKIAMTEIVISVVEREWNRVLTEVAESRKISSLRPKQLLWLDALEARARFELAFRHVPKPAEGDFFIPSTGLPQVDYDELRKAYDVSRRAILSAQRLNWPADIKYILDVFPVSAMLLGYSAEAMPLMAALGLARAAVTPIREVVAKLAVQFDQPEIALQMGERAGTSPKFEHESSVMAVATLRIGQVDKALAFATEDFLSNPSPSDIYLSALLGLGMASNSTLRTDLLTKIRARLDWDENSRHYLAILDSAVEVHQSLLKRHEAIQKLHAYWTEKGRPTIVGYHLLLNTDARNEDEAKLFVDVAQSIELENSLGNEQLADYGQALLTIGRVDDAISKLSYASTRFRDDPKIQSLLGIALEINGQSPEAFNLFEHLLNEGKASETARRYYVEIAARMGFFDRAEQQVRTAYSNVTGRDRKLRLLNTLFQLLLAEGKRPVQIEEVAWEYGRLADQSDEREEGIFLQEYLVATLPESLSVNPERVEEFQRRLDEYSERFPESKFLWRAQLPTEGPPEAMLSALKKATGLTDEDIEKANAIERKMDRGVLEVPFSWRPRRVLRNVSDLFMLWEIRKVAPFERAALHFRSSIGGYDRQVPKNLGACKAVVSLTSLLLLDELGLLELVLDAFPRIVVARATLITLQEARNKFTSGWGREKATRIIERLQKDFPKISHPPYLPEEGLPRAPEWYYEEKRAMEEASTVYFSDDIVETYIVCRAGENAPPRPSISTIDFLTWADQTAGLISPLGVADAIGHMTRLRVMAVSVEQRYFIASIPEALNKATSQAQAEAVLLNAQTFNSILDGVWDHFKPFQELLNHFSANMSYLLNEGGANEEVLVSLWLRWLETVRFQEKPQIPPSIKMLSAFISILRHLMSDKAIVSRLWGSYWTTLLRGLGSELNGPEDRVAIKEVGMLLGTRRAIKEQEADAIVLFEKAKLGLEPGTERETWFNEEYLDSMVRQEKANQTSR